MTKAPFTTRVDIVRSNPFVATLTFETDYSRSSVRVSRNNRSEKFWVQGADLPSKAVEKITDISEIVIAEAFCRRAHWDRAERMGSQGVVVRGGNGNFYIDETSSLSPGALFLFAKHVIEEFDRRQIPWPEDVESAVADGLRAMEAAA